MSDDNGIPSIMVMKFADSKIPEWKEVNNKDWILYGETNSYGEYLVYQYNKCGKHRAIVNGKSKYIFGKGFEGAGGLAPVKNEDGTVTPAVYVNRAKETMYDIVKKSIKDIEIHGGFRWLVTFGVTGNVAEIYHEDFNKFRTAKKDIGGFFFKEKWIKPNGQPNNKEEAKPYKEFTGNAPAADDENKTQVFAYNEYGPGSDEYPLPEYIGCANYIDIDIEISKFHLSTLRNGMMPSKMIQFYTGEPPEDKKKEVERRWKEKFAGSENAGKFILVFNSTKDKTVDVQDLSFTDLDKQFEILNKTTQQEIFTGHQVTSPMLFGIKTEGQLGGNTELRTAYEIFINTYAKPKQEDLEKIINFFGEKLGKGNSYTFKQLDPIGIVIDDARISAVMTDDEVREKIGLPKLNNGAGVVQPDGQASEVSVNENVKNLSAKQYQQLVRIIREFNKGKLRKEAAALLLKSSLGLSDEDIEVLLAPDAPEDNTIEQQMKFIEDMDSVVQLFSACGDLKKDFTIVKSKKIKFASEASEFSMHQEFKEAALTLTEGNILDLISKDKRITPEVIAETIGSTVDYVEAKIGKLEKSGLLRSKDKTIGNDVQVERELTKPLKEIIPPTVELETTEILIKYSYEGPKDNRNRPFCAKLMELDRLYSRAEIETISSRLGYSVWDRRGGWWTQPDGDRLPHCRHSWVSNIVVRKKKGGVK